MNTSTQKQYDIAVIVGSLRRESYNRKVANVLAKMAQPALKLEIVEIGDLELCNQDLDHEPTQAWTKFRERIKKADAILFVTPEYNRSIPAPLKNAVDVGSRPYGKSVWDGKPAAIVSVSTSVLGGFGANHHLRQSMVTLNVPVMPQPEVYIGGAATLFDESGKLTQESTRELLEKFLLSFERWIIGQTRDL